MICGVSTVSAAGIAGAQTFSAEQATPSTNQVQPTKVVLGSSSFQIPFDITRTGSVPQEVRLYVARATRDGGSQGISGSSQNSRAPLEMQGQWQLLDRQTPDAGQFELEETPDGIFWFATRTIDSSGRPHPPGPIQPELQVTVDTSRPVVQLDADAEADGKVQAAFTIDDVTDCREVTMHYVTDTTRAWKIAKVLRDGSSGVVGFDPADNWKQLSLRLRVLDQAGNETIVSKKIERPRMASKQSTRFASGPSTLAPDNTRFVQNSGTNPFGGGNLPSGLPAFNQNSLPPPSTPEQISQDFGMKPYVESIPTPQANSIAPLNRGQSTRTQQQSPRTPAEAMRPITPAIQQVVPPAQSSIEEIPLSGKIFPSPPLPTQQLTPPKTVTPGLSQSSDAPNLPRQIRADAMPETTFDSSPEPKTEPVQLNRPADPNPTALQSSESEAKSVWSPIDASERSGEDRPRFSSEETKAYREPVDAAADTERYADRESGGRVDLERLAKRAVVRQSDSHQFSLDYEIEAIGARGVEAIELYGTTDGGQTWKRWGDDPDKRSPFDIETNGEGIFGFNIVVVATNGLASPRPLGGDIPDIVVVVDKTRPDVSLTGAQYGEGDRAGSLVIRYQCEDEYLMERPITLAFSDSPQGPWTTIAAGLRNLGDYVWPADPKLPRQIYLRIDATDKAGNVGSYVLDSPIDTRGLAPRARIRAFRSIPNR